VNPGERQKRKFLAIGELLASGSQRDCLPLYRGSHLRL